MLPWRRPVRRCAMMHTDGKRPVVAANLSTLERSASAMTGAACVLLAARRRSFGGALLMAGGTALLVRGASGFCPVQAWAGAAGANGRDTRSALGGAGGIHVAESITIQKDPAELYRFWRDLENLPRFMSHLVSVTETDPQRSHWIAQAPAGTTVEWDAEIIQDIADEMIAWRTLKYADVISAGSVHFKPTGRGHETHVRVTLQYEPPAGRVGSAVARMFGQEPSQSIREDLRRCKALLETGEIPTTAGQPRGRRSILNYD
jgi:uncharacterized membrane protein